jgi:hypothetical protein
MRIEMNKAEFDRLVQVIQRDPRKSAVLAVLAVVLLGLWGRLMFGGPKRATASPAAVLPSDPHMTAVKNPPRHTADDAMLAWLNEKERPGGRNLFAVNLEDYPREGARDMGGARLEGMGDEVGKPNIGLTDHETADAATRELKPAEELRVGVRKGMTMAGREKLAEAAYQNALDELNKPTPDRNMAMWDLNVATNLNPTFEEAIELKEKLAGRRVMDVDNSSVRSFVARAILAEEKKGP